MLRLRYPVDEPSEWRTYEGQSPLKRLDTWWRQTRYRRIARSKDREAHIACRSGRTSLSANDIPLILCVRDGEVYIDPFLRHYRKLGVTRFIVLDDRSSDNTSAILSDQSDVDVWTSALDYTQAQRGALWRDALLDVYGRDRWYVSVDVDEFLVYPHCETRPLGHFVQTLDALGLRRALAPMLDTYPDGALSQADFSRAVDIHDLAPLIDGAGYRSSKLKFGTAIFGGPRYRLYGTAIRLSKFPLLFADGPTQYFGGSIHGPLPFSRNFQAPMAVLLHLKFAAHSAEEFTRFVDQGHHSGGSEFYKMILDSGRFDNETNLRYDGSIRWKSSDELVSRGFIMDIRSLDP